MSFLIRSSSSAASTINGISGISGINGGVSGGRSEVNYEGNVDQDISKLAARTHADQNSNHVGRRRMMSQQDGEAPRPDLVTGVSTFEKAAQGGQGFQTYGVDLGVLGSRNNVDEEMRKQSSANGGIAGGSRSSSSSSSSFNTQSSSGGGQRTGYTYSSQGGSNNQQSSNDDGYEYDGDDYDENDDDQSQGGTQQRGTGGGGSSSYRSSSSYSSYTPKKSLNVHHESVDQQFKHYPAKRTVRQAPFVVTDPLCKSTRCVNVRCVVGPLEKNNGALIALRTRLVAHTLHKVIKTKFVIGFSN